MENKQPTEARQDELAGIKRQWAKILEEHGVFDIEDELLACTVSSGKDCPWCGGSGKGFDLSGGVTKQIDCPACNGTGQKQLKTLGEIIKGHQNGR